MRKLLLPLVNSAGGLARALSLYAPYLGAGVRVDHISPDFREARVSMKLRWYNVNYVGTHFGGSLYAMTDPFYMLLLMRNLGPDYVVWDKAASIDFVRPGRGRVMASFLLSDAMLTDVRQHTASGDKYTPTWPVEVIDEDGKLVARVEKTLYIRRKQTGRQSN